MAPAVSYQPLLEQLASLRDRAARFLKVVLHLHSPNSHDWARNAPDTLDDPRRMFPGQDGPGDFADELQKHFELVAITDHMRCDFATQVSIKIGTNDTFMVLPGMEVNFRPEAALGHVRIHLLVILPEGSTKEAFARLFAGLAAIPDDSQRTGNEEVTGIPLKDWVVRVHAENGVCIAAHVDNSQGLRCRFRQTARDTLSLFCEDDAVNLERDNNVGDALKEYLFQSHIDAVEITKGADAPHYRWVSHADGRALYSHNPDLRRSLCDRILPARAHYALEDDSSGVGRTQGCPQFS